MGQRTHHFSWLTIVFLLCLAAFGLFSLLSISPDLFWQQLIILGVGLAILVGISFIDSVMVWWFAPFAYVVANILLALSYLGPSIRGSTRWIMIAGGQLQPSEVVKPLLLLSFAYFMTKYPPRNIRNLPIHIGLFIVPFLLVFKQPDLGSSIVYASFWFSMLLAGGLSLVVVAVVAVLGIILMPVLWHALAEYQKTRILTFLDPALDPRGGGYNALQAMIAVGSGQLTGRGLGRGTQSHLRFLPEHHTDFIFATLIEELGFLGGLLLFSLYAGLLLGILLPLYREFRHDAPLFLYSVGLLGMLLSQIFINTGMNMGLIPITGITLPFVSYGGSSILSLSIAFGLLWALRQGKSRGSAIAIR